MFGGNGFVGTRVCEEALNTGLAVVSISRSATPKVSAHWTSQVDWVSVSLCFTQSCRSHTICCMHLSLHHCGKPMLDISNLEVKLYQLAMLPVLCVVACPDAV